MEIKYLKNHLRGNQDFYIKGEDEMNIIVMTPEYFFCMANDENFPIVGPYKKLNLTKDQYEELKELALSKERSKGINLLSKIHSKNDLENKPLQFYGEIPDYMSVTRENLLESFEKSEPILNQ